MDALRERARRPLGREAVRRRGLPQRRARRLGEGAPLDELGEVVLADVTRPERPVSVEGDRAPRPLTREALQT